MSPRLVQLFLTKQKKIIRDTLFRNFPQGEHVDHVINRNLLGNTY